MYFLLKMVSFMYAYPVSFNQGVYTSRHDLDRRERIENGDIPAKLVYKRVLLTNSSGFLCPKSCCLSFY